MFDDLMKLLSEIIAGIIAIVALIVYPIIGILLILLTGLFAVIAAIGDPLYGIFDAISTRIKNFISGKNKE